MFEELERKLDSFNADERKKALSLLLEKVDAGEMPFPKAGTGVNLHCHTFFSYNTYGYSPSKFAWLARKAGLAVAGVVDFDVLDGMEEFLTASRKLGLKGCVGLETRVFVPEFSTRVINSTGEPGISYCMGVGFPKAKLEGQPRTSEVRGQPGEFLLELRKTAEERNRDLMGRVNRELQPVELDYECDVLVLTPSGNATERHICLAYARKAKEVFNDDNSLRQFWVKKLGPEAELLELPESVDLLNMIRAKTMKRGGQNTGWKPVPQGSFPLMADFNQFVLAAGGIPTMTWLNGLSEGEQAIEELIEVAMSTGVAAINIIPDRNYTPRLLARSRWRRTGVKDAEVSGIPMLRDRNLENLYQVVELAVKLHIPVVVGTEMNSPGQKFVDDFGTKELSPLIPIFLKGAHIVYGHSVLQRKCGLGYTSDWAAKMFKSIPEKNEFYEKVGLLIKPAQEDIFAGLNDKASAQEILIRSGECKVQSAK